MLFLSKLFKLFNQSKEMNNNELYLTLAIQKQRPTNFENFYFERNYQILIRISFINSWKASAITKMKQKILYYLYYADDAVIFAETMEVRVAFLDALSKESESLGL